MLLRRPLILLVVLNLIAHPAFADIVMLRDGEKHVGVVENRDQVRAHPEQYLHIRLLPKDSAEPLLFPVGDIDYVAFQDGDEMQVVDFKALTPRSALAQDNATVAAVAGMDSKGRGFGIIAAGVAAAGIGIFVKFGEEQATAGSSSFGRTERSYNALNYALIGLGVLLVAVGIAKQADSTKWLSHNADGLMIGGNPGMRESGAVVGYRVTF